MNTLIQVLIILAIVGLIWSIMYFESDEYIKKTTNNSTYVEVCLNNYSYYRFHSGYKAALAPVIEDDKFKKCGR